MRTESDHLPEGKRRELERVVQILFEEFEDAHVAATSRRKRGRILKVILYGSYARGGWVDEPHTAKGYQSDFDLLVIVDSQELIDGRYWEKAEERLNVERAITRTLKTPVNFIVHTLQEVNDGLAHGRYFFIDVARDGVALYQADDSELHAPKPKTPEQALSMAQEYFAEWFPSGAGMLKTAHFSVEEGRLKDGAFLTHQAAERLYHCVLLVCTFYTPHVHNLAFLRTQAERIDRRLTHIWPAGTRSDRARFDKLKQAYVKARYSKHYRISTEELGWLGNRVEELGRTVHAICTEKLATLAKAAKQPANGRWGGLRPGRFRALNWRKPPFVHAPVVGSYAPQFRSFERPGANPESRLSLVRYRSGNSRALSYKPGSGRRMKPGHD